MTRFARSPRPSTSIWGAIQQADEIAAGIWSVMTASHGGIILSEERQEAMPEALRLEGAQYEEDCDWSLPILAFSEELEAAKSCSPGVLQLARDTAKCWHPDRYSKHNGTEVPEAESHVLRTRNLYLAAIGEFAVTAAWGDWADWVPEGQVGVVALRVTGANHLGRPTYGDEEVFALIPKEIYGERTGVTVLRDTEHTIIEAPEGLRPKRVA